MIVVAKPRRRQIIDEMVADLESPPDERLEEVRDFVEFIARRTSPARGGSAEALLRSFGQWKGPPGELDRLVEEIYEARHQEK